MECDASHANFRFYSPTYVGDQTQAPTLWGGWRAFSVFCFASSRAVTAEPTL